MQEPCQGCRFDRRIRFPPRVSLPDATSSFAVDLDLGERVRSRTAGAILTPSGVSQLWVEGLRNVSGLTQSFFSFFSGGLFPYSLLATSFGPAFLEASFGERHPSLEVASTPFSLQRRCLAHWWAPFLPTLEVASTPFSLQRRCSFSLAAFAISASGGGRGTSGHVPLQPPGPFRRGSWVIAAADFRPVAVGWVPCPVRPGADI